MQHPREAAAAGVELSSQSPLPALTLVLTLAAAAVGEVVIEATGECWESAAEGSESEVTWGAFD